MVYTASLSQGLLMKPGHPTFTGQGGTRGRVRFGEDTSKPPGSTDGSSGTGASSGADDAKGPDGGKPPTDKADKPAGDETKSPKSGSSWAPTIRKFFNNLLKYAWPVIVIGLPFFLPSVAIVGSFALAAGVPLLSTLMKADVDDTGKLKNRPQVNRMGWKFIRRLFAPLRWIIRKLPGKKWKRSFYQFFVSQAAFIKNKMIDAFETKTVSSIVQKWRKKGALGKFFLLSQLILSGVGMYIRSRFKTFRCCGSALLFITGASSMTGLWSNFVNEITGPEKKPDPPKKA